MSLDDLLEKAEVSESEYTQALEVSSMLWYLDVSQMNVQLTTITLQLC